MGCASSPVPSPVASWAAGRSWRRHGYRIPHCSTTGTLWARQNAPILPGKRYVLLGWHIAPPGDASSTSRSRLAGSAILDDAGAVCAVGRAVWVLDRG